ncbi:ICP22 family protein [Nocardiopsis aegyptia]|uniref:Uncharacterized protein n=1 Tax=Nocardiopsis aegyptia TaxID=220378 RepID=A0A7Z0EUF6_9ACTN|nr:hypothetical protein [Nocardiopsis aegyptia]NYJ37513.1 hypothetical protein [Nocardiopsis aegyptia]
MGRTGHDGDHGDQGTGEGGGEAGKRIDLSLSQVAGAGAATLTAATAASYLNVYGTVIGAAVIAILSTVASPLLQHWFSRGGEQARQLAGRVRAGDAAPAAASSTRAARGAAVPVDATRTMALPVVGDGPGPGGPDGRHGQDGPDGTGTPARPRPTWRGVVIPAVVVFVLVMLVILAFELLTGRSLTAWTNGVDEQTSPSLLGGTHVTQEQDDAGSTDTGQSPEQDTGTTGDRTAPPPATQAPDDTATTGEAPAEGDTGQDGQEEQADPEEQPDPGATAPPEDGGTEGGDQTTDPGTGDGQESVVVPEDVPATG